MTEPAPLDDPFRPGKPRPVRHDPYNDLVGQLPNSWVAWRDGAFELLKGMPDFGGRVDKTYIWPTKDEDLPCLKIALIGERMHSDSFNQGEPHFDHKMTLLISIMASAADPVVLDGQIFLLAEAVKSVLLTDYAWINMAEGIMDFNTTISYPKESQLPLCEIQMEIVGFLQSRWQPVTPNKFNEAFILRRLTTEQDDQPGLDDDITTMYEGG